MNISHRSEKGDRGDRKKYIDYDLTKPRTKTMFIEIDSHWNEGSKPRESKHELLND